MILPLRIGILIMAMAAFACGDDEDENPTGGGGCASETSAIAALDGVSSTGQPIFASTCGNAACHGANGDDGPAPNLSTVAAGQSVAALVTVVNCGSGNMPALNQLSDQDIADVVAYVRATF